MYLTWNKNVNDIILCLQIANHKLLSRFYVHIPSFFKMNPSDEVHEEHSDIKIEESEEIEVLSLDDIKDNQPRSLISISSKKDSRLNQELFLSITSLTESLREGEEPESLISISSNQSFQSITTSVISSQSESSNPKCWTRNDSWQYRKLRLVKKEFLD